MTTSRMVSRWGLKVRYDAIQLKFVQGLRRPPRCPSHHHHRQLAANQPLTWQQLCSSWTWSVFKVATHQNRNVEGLQETLKGSEHGWWCQTCPCMNMDHSEVRVDTPPPIPAFPKHTAHTSIAEPPLRFVQFHKRGFFPRRTETHSWQLGAEI